MAHARPPVEFLVHLVSNLEMMGKPSTGQFDGEEEMAAVLGPENNLKGRTCASRAVILPSRSFCRVP